MIHLNFDPIAIHFGQLSVRWYGIMYLIAFVLGSIIARLRLKLPHIAQQRWSVRDIDDVMFYGIFGVIFGGRLGYILFYKPVFYFTHPIDILRIWEGGMSFHGGFIGVTIPIILFAWRRRRQWLQVTDFIAPIVPVGLAVGRFGNFINGELWGRVTHPSSPWAMLFTGTTHDDALWLSNHPELSAKWNLDKIFTQYCMLPRHPSQLYEIALEGFVLFIIMWVFSRKPRPIGTVSALFLSGYGLLRFIVEFAREPDDFLGLLAFGLSIGQWLSLPMFFSGIVMMMWMYRYETLKSI